MTHLLPWLPTLAYTTLVFVLSTTPNPPVPPAWLPFHDKGAHFLVYVVVAIFFAYGLRTTRPASSYRSTALLACLACTVLSIATEITQLLLPRRAFEAPDVMANLLGSVTGLCVYALGARLLRAMRTAAITDAPAAR